MSRIEIRCLECRYLDPAFWRNLQRCNCSHYWESKPVGKQIVFKSAYIKRLYSLGIIVDDD